MVLSLLTASIVFAVDAYNMTCLHLSGGILYSTLEYFPKYV